ncbi:MAG: hypothetical protein E6K18_04525 [Methanobacteriota archaeon]|nr:MAG: hypothetical protein E6K18_04525 [Euryarchaeota archaeon]
MAVSLLESPHLARLYLPPPDSHAILWSDGSAECDAAIDAFITGAAERGDMVMVVLPRSELATLRERLRLRGTDLDALVDGGHLFRTVTEDVMPRRPEDVERSPQDMAAIAEFARISGKNGLSVLSRIGSLFFDRGDQAMASLVERTGQAHRSGVRTLCLYNAKNLKSDRFSDAVSLTRTHTDAITAVGGGRFFVETAKKAPQEILVS